ncbi:MAG: hypothetical protein WCD07_07900 [Burkholderiales bacterium]
MFINYKLTALALLASASILALPLAQAKGPAYDPYEDLSGTHPSSQITQEGMRGREGAAGERGPEGKSMFGRPGVVGAYDAFEELSGTHATKRIAQSGVQGPGGAEGRIGAAGRTSGSPLYNLPGDVENGCSKFLRCSAE